MSATATLDEPLPAPLERPLALFDQAPAFIAILTGPDHVYEWVNQAYSRLLGGRALVGIPVRQAVPEVADQGFFELLDDVYRSGERYVAQHVSVRLQTELGEPLSERFLDFIYEPIRDEQGRVTGVFCDGHDITEQHLAQEALKVTQKRQAALIELSDRLRDLDDPADISFAAAELLGRELDVSRAGYGTIDREKETIFIERDWNAPGSASLAGVLNFRDYGSYIEDLKRGETVVFADAEIDPRTRDRASALKAISAQAVVNMPITEQGGFVALLYLNHAVAREWPEDELAFVREVAERTRTAVERRRAEQELRQLAATLERQVSERTQAAIASEARMRSIFESSYQYQGLMTLDGVLLEANRASLAGIRSRLEDVVGRPFWETPWFSASPGMPAMVRGAIPKVAAGETLRQEIRVNLPEGGWRWFDFTLRPLRDAVGRVVGIVPEAMEITDRRNAEEALRQSQKLESMGQLTGGVAHDFNNLLTPIIGSLDMLQRRGFGGAREQRLLEAALASAERAKTLVQRLLAFARRQPLQPTAVDVGALMNGMAELVASTTGPQITVTVEVEAELPAAHADPNQLEMAILNLSVNARDAMPEGGALRLSASKATLGEGRPSGLAPGTYVRVAVSDTGVGMDEWVAARAVEPFFSTKGVGKGTGLGLSMVHGLASQLGGALSVSSAPGQGATIELWLPVSEEAPRPPEAAASGPAARGVGTVLLVDDEAFVRMSTAEMLAELGYNVVEAGSAEEAMTILARQGVDLMVTDHLMPGMTGVELARAAKGMRAGLPVILISGFAESEGVAIEMPRLTKPFRQAELAAIIAAVRG